MPSLSEPALALLARARSCEHAVDLYLAPGATRATSDRLGEVLRNAEASQLNERALWNLLFAAGELSLGVDVYRAHELFLAAASLVPRVAALDYPAGDPRAVAVEMAFDFFFARPAHPLLPLRAAEVLKVLAELLASGRRAAVRAAIHGLGHLIGSGARAPPRTQPMRRACSTSIKRAASAGRRMRRSAATSTKPAAARCPDASSSSPEAETPPA